MTSTTLPTPAAGTPRAAGHSRRLLGLALLVAALAALVFASLALGAKATSISELTRAWPTAWEILRGHTDTAQAAGTVGSSVAEIAGILPPCASRAPCSPSSSELRSD